MICTINFLILPCLPAIHLPLQSHLCSRAGSSATLSLPLSSTLNWSCCLLLPSVYSLARPCVCFCLPREQFLKSNAQLTFRCRQLLSELSYIYPIDVVSAYHSQVHIHYKYIKYTKLCTFPFATFLIFTPKQIENVLIYSVRQQKSSQYSLTQFCLDILSLK